MSDMQSVATLFEYQPYRYERSKRDYFENGILHLTEKTIEYLEDLNHSRPFMECGLKSIKPLNYVGVIKAGELTIQVFPKLFKDEKYKEHLPTIAANLLKMLSYSGNVPFRSMDITNLNYERYELFEIFIHLFAKNLLFTLKSSQKREYMKKSEDIRVIKGRINFRKYNNPCRLHIIPCEYHEFSIDNTLNRTLKYTCSLMARTVGDFSTAKNLRSIINILDQVTFTPISVSEVEKITFNRLNRIFEPFIVMCKIFLSRSALTLQSSSVEFFSLLIPMEKLFEEFIAEVLQENPGYFFGKPTLVNSQLNIGKMATDEHGKELFNIRPDIVIGYPLIEAIIDTKYKALDDTDAKLGVSQSDLYQMYAYSTKTNTERCMLLYPEVLLEQKKDLFLSVPSDKGITREVVLLIRAIRLSYNMIDQEGWNDFRSELRSIMEPLLLAKPYGEPVFGNTGMVKLS